MHSRASAHFFPGHSMQAAGLTHPAQGRASLLLPDVESSPCSVALARGSEVSVQARGTVQRAISYSKHEVSTVEVNLRLKATVN